MFPHMWCQRNNFKTFSENVDDRKHIISNNRNSPQTGKKFLFFHVYASRTLHMLPTQQLDWKQIILLFSLIMCRRKIKIFQQTLIPGTLQIVFFLNGYFWKDAYIFFRKLVVYDEWSSITIHVALDNTLIVNDVCKFWC